jgi:tRNA1Val (adenine37-N6)-methyltransferase
VTLDHPAPGVVIAQPERGFRYAVDAFWLAGFALATGERPRDALDLGTGSGIVAMLLGAQGIPTVGVDHRPEWRPLWAETLANSETAAPVELRLADVRDGVPRDRALVVANPPYFTAGAGPASPDPWKRAARTESTASVAAFVAIAVGALSPTGRACLVVDRTREADVLAAGSASGARPARVVRVGRRRSLLCLVRGGGAGPPAEEFAPGDDVVQRWVRLARGGGAP